MTSLRTIVIGDVHGCLAELEELLATVQHTSSDRLIFVGDLINKGPDSLGVLRKVRSLGAEVILGNHELSFLQRFDKGTEHPLFGKMGGELQDWVDWIRSWPLFIDDPSFLVVHGGIIPETPIAEIPAKVITKIRTWDGVGNDLQNSNNPPWYEFYAADKLIVFGHWAVRGLVVRDNVIGLDSGCCYGRQLSAVILPDREIVQVQAQSSYVDVS